jgi:thiamine biosynthesis protein ThiI
MDEAAKRVGQVFGIVQYSRAAQVEKDFTVICEAAAEYLGEELDAANTFKVNAKRADKSFPMASPAICAELGAYLLDKFPHLTVDVHEPDVTVTVEVRDFGAYIHGSQLHGAGGIPVGTGGKAAILISGGIDSPVAAWTIAKRGVELTPIHFASPPYTSERAEMKVISLLEKVALYSGPMTLRIVPFTEIQEAIVEKCPEDLFTIIMRRFMMKLAERVAILTKNQALVTGESLGQVASQTIQAIGCTDEAVKTMPVFRPLIGMDKEEIIRIARRIDTFETSIQPYEDCCTVFTPKHPRTRPVLDKVIEAEKALDTEALMQRAIEGIRRVKIGVER